MPSYTGGGKGKNFYGGHGDRRSIGIYIIASRSNARGGHNGEGGKREGEKKKRGRSLEQPMKKKPCKKDIDPFPSGI